MDFVLGGMVSGAIVRGALGGGIPGVVVGGLAGGFGGAVWYALRGYVQIV